jgi:hypothetical protein
MLVGMNSVSEIALRSPGPLSIVMGSGKAQRRTHMGGERNPRSGISQVREIEVFP